MTLVISTGVSLSSSWLFPADPDAAAYVAAVEAADGQTLETATKAAIDNFVIGCKADGIWNAIKASCIMAGARTLAGALVPLRGTAPTNFNFVAGDYDRKTGLLGAKTSNKNLSSNRSNSAEPQNNRHAAVYVTSIQLTGFLFSSNPYASAGASFIFLDVGAGGYVSLRSSSNQVEFTGQLSNLVSNRLYGVSRSSGTSYNFYRNNTAITVSSQSNSPDAGNIHIFGDSVNGGLTTTSRLSFYSIGEAIDLALLDARVTGLMNDFAAVIP